MRSLGKALLCCVLLTGICVAQEKPVNIVLIVADDLGIKDLGCYGSDFYRTPALERLAREGMVFSIEDRQRYLENHHNAVERLEKERKMTAW